VFIGLSRLFSLSNLEGAAIGTDTMLPNSVGLFIQKTDCIRDYFEDLCQGQHFWPRQVTGNQRISGIVVSTKHWLTFRIQLRCHSNETRAAIINPLNSAQLGGILYHSQSYIRIRAVVWKCGEGQTNRHTDARDQYTFRVVFDSHEMY